MLSIDTSVNVSWCCVLTSDGVFFFFYSRSLIPVLTPFLCVSAQEQISLLVSLLRRAMVLVGLLALVYVAVRYRNVTKESLEILTQLKETRTSLELALQKAGRFGYLA